MPASRAAREMTRNFAAPEETFDALRREIDNEPEYQRLLAEFPLPGD